MTNRTARYAEWLYLAMVGLVGAGFLAGACTSTPEPEADPPRAILDSGGPLPYAQAAYNVYHYALALTVDPDGRTIDGHAEIHAGITHPLDQFVLDLDTTFTVTAMELKQAGGWQALSYARRHGQVAATFPQMQQPGDTVQVRVHYGGAPREAPNPPWDGGFTWAETPDGAPWIATSVQTNGADLWWPVKDHPADKPDSVALAVRVPGSLTVASNGVLESTRSHADGTATFRWVTRQPIAPYNVALNIAPYEVMEDRFESIGGETVPLYFYTLPGRSTDAARLLEQAKEHLAFYEELLGPYPFRAEKYGIAHTPFLGMEHQTIIAYGDEFLDGAHGFDWIHHHELGHEWWGNMVTAADWRDFWIHEGFGTYMQALYAEATGGPEAYRSELSGYREQLRNQRPVAPRSPHSTVDIYFRDGPGSASNHDIYYKGAWVLHTLRWIMGDAAFFDAIRAFAYPTEAHRTATDGSQSRFATTDDFLTIVNAHAGADFSWFFETYLRQPVLPTLSTEREGATLTLRWDQPAGVPVETPVEVEVDGERRRVPMNQGTGSLSLPSEANVTIDPNGWLLRRP